MKYQITNQLEQFSSLKTDFLNSYNRFLSSECENTFGKICNTSLCASIILKNDEPYSFCFHRVFELNSAETTNPYFKGVDKSVLQSLIGKKIFTIEWLTVAPKHLGKFTKVQPADLMLGCAFKLLESSNFDLTMGYSRQDNKTDKLTMRFGTKAYGTVERFKLPCSVIVMNSHELVSHPLKIVQSTIDELWMDRENTVANIERSNTKAA